MKKLVLIAMVASFATSAFAQNGKGMVELNGCLDNGRCDTLDYRNLSNDENELNGSALEDADEEQSSVALNYNYLFTDNLGAGLKYMSQTSTVDGDVATDDFENNTSTIGVNVFWNFDGGWESGYVALRYDMTTGEKTEDKVQIGTVTEEVGIDTKNAITLEAGKRMKMGKIFGLALLYSPSVSYTSTATEFQHSEQDDESETELRLNVANFAMAF